MLQEKRPLCVADLEAECALELPDREMMGLVTIVIADVLNNNTVNVVVRNNNVAVQVCAAVTAIAALVNQQLTCTIMQR